MAMNPNSPPSLPMKAIYADPSRSISSHSSISVIRQRPAKARAKLGARLVISSPRSALAAAPDCRRPPQGEGPIRFRKTPEFGLAQPADALDPPKGLLDTLADAEA